MIRKVLLSTVAVVAISGTAFAADLPSRRAPPVFIPPPIPVFSWTGFYIGGQVGYDFGRDQATEVGVTGSNQSFNVGQYDGLLGGAHVGYNFSTQSFPLLGGFGGSGGVIGVEGDVNGGDVRSRTTFTGVGRAPGLIESDHDNIEGSLRGRVGIAVDRALFYATGGAAFGEIEDSYMRTGPGNTSAFQALTKTHVGYTVGGGMEYALTTNWSLRAEYRYTDYGRYVDVNDGALGVGFNTTHKLNFNLAQIGFSYKFDTPAILAPVVARY